MEVVVENDGYIRGASQTSCVTTLIMVLVYAAAFRWVIDSKSGGAATTLVALPALLSYIAVGVGDYD
jgi:uncharacterized membrane protein (UPF0136 family)